MDQLTVHTPGLKVFVLTLRQFKLDCLMTSKTSGNDRLYTAAKRSPLQDEKISWEHWRVNERWKTLQVGRRSNWWPGHFLILDTLNRRATLAKHSTTLHMNYENKVGTFAKVYSFFPCHNNSTIAIFLQGQRIGSFLLSILCYLWHLTIFRIFFFFYFLLLFFILILKWEVR